MLQRRAAHRVRADRAPPAAGCAELLQLRIAMLPAGASGAAAAARMRRNSHRPSVATQRRVLPALPHLFNGLQEAAVVGKRQEAAGEHQIVALVACGAGGGGWGRSWGWRAGRRAAPLVRQRDGGPERRAPVRQRPLPPTPTCRCGTAIRDAVMPWEAGPPSETACIGRLAPGWQLARGTTRPLSSCATPLTIGGLHRAQ